jgi:DNA-binding transcriptional ArsR family regulator
MMFLLDSGRCRVYLTAWLINWEVKYNMLIDQLSATFAALADPTRRAILSRLAAGEATVGELAEPFEMSLPAVSKHLRVLENAGLIARGREAQWRPCRLEAAPLKEVADWVESYRRHWEESLDRLDEYLRELQKRESQNRQSKTREKKHVRTKK